MPPNKPPVKRSHALQKPGLEAESKQRTLISTPMPILTRYPKRHDSRPIRAHRKPSQHASAMSANGNDRGCAPRDTWSGRITPSNAVAQDLVESRWKIAPARPHGDRFRKNICTVNSMTSSPRPAPPALLHAILKSERVPRSLRARPDGKSAAQRFIVSAWASKPGRR